MNKLLSEISKHFEDLFELLRTRQNLLVLEVNENYDKKMKNADDLETADLDDLDVLVFQNKFNETLNKTDTIKFVASTVQLEQTAEMVKKPTAKARVVISESNKFN